MNTRGRTPGFQMGEEHRTKIRNSKLLNRLIGHVESETDTMSPSQVTAALGLLKKVMPDLSQSDVHHKHDRIEELTDQEIAARIAELRGATASDGGATTPVDPSQLN